MQLLLPLSAASIALNFEYQSSYIRRKISSAQKAALEYEIEVALNKYVKKYQIKVQSLDGDGDRYLFALGLQSLSFRLQG